MQEQQRVVVIVWARWQWQFEWQWAVTVAMGFVGDVGGAVCMIMRLLNGTAKAAECHGPFDLHSSTNPSKC